MIDQVIADADYTVIARRDAPDAVAMSLDTFNDLMETVRLRKSSQNSPHWLPLSGSSARLQRGSRALLMPSDRVSRLS